MKEALAWGIAYKECRFLFISVLLSLILSSFYSCPLCDYLQHHIMIFKSVRTEIVW